MKKTRSNRGSANAQKHPYLRSELWANGTLAFYFTKGHRTEAYMDFHQRQEAEAARLNRL